jgi:hypothetical protein
MEVVAEVTQCTRKDVFASGIKVEGYIGQTFAQSQLVDISLLRLRHEFVVHLLVVGCVDSKLQSHVLKRLGYHDATLECHAATGSTVTRYGSLVLLCSRGCRSGYAHYHFNSIGCAALCAASAELGSKASGFIRF